MKGRIFFVIASLALWQCGADAQVTQVPAPASVADSILEISTIDLDLNSDAVIWLRADGSYVYLLSNVTFAGMPQAIPPNGTYTYAVSPTNPSMGTVTFSSGQGSYSLLFATPTTGYANTVLSSFTLAPAVAPSSAVNVSNNTVITPTQSTTTGFVVGGSTPRWVLLRAVGPGLQQFGVAGPLATPTLQLYSGSRPIRTLGSWSAFPNPVPGMQAVFALTGAFPLPTGSADCAGIIHLAPGAYTMTCSSPSGSGQALSEVYILPY